MFPSAPQTKLDKVNSREARVTMAIATLFETMKVKEIAH